MPFLWIPHFLATTFLSIHPKLQNKYIGHLYHISNYITVFYDLSTSLFCGNAFNFCLILAHPDLSADRVVLSWLWINDHI
jgi:hypothetical protein